MQTSRQYLKKWLNHSIIGLLVIGGLYFFTASSAFAVVTVTEPSSNHFDITSMPGNYVCFIQLSSEDESKCPTYSPISVNPPSTLSVVTGGPDNYEVAFCSSLSGGFCISFVDKVFYQVDAAGHLIGYGPEIGQLTSTRFVSVSPENGSTTATTTSVGANLYANGADFVNQGSGYGRLHIHFHQNSASACTNSGALFDAVVTCSGYNIPRDDFNLDFGTTTATQIVSGDYIFTNSITFPGPGKWTVEYDIQQVSSPWYLFGLNNTYTTIVSTTTTVIIGALSPMDSVQEQVASATAAITALTQQGIGAILASTTASLKGACNIISTGFSIGDCLTLIVWPGNAAIADDFTIVKQIPPWGYVFRFIDILNATTSTSSLPQIIYTFATSSPFGGMGAFHFDPFGSIAEAGSLVGEMTSDRSDHKTVWQILMPVVDIFMYLVLAFMIIHDLTGIHKHAGEQRHKDRDET